MLTQLDDITERVSSVDPLTPGQLTIGDDLRIVLELHPQVAESPYLVVYVLHGDSDVAYPGVIDVAVPSPPATAKMSSQRGIEQYKCTAHDRISSRCDRSIDRLRGQTQSFVNVNRQVKYRGPPELCKPSIDRENR